MTKFLSILLSALLALPLSSLPAFAQGPQTDNKPHVVITSEFAPGQGYAPAIPNEKTDAIPQIQQTTVKLQTVNTALQGVATESDPVRQVAGTQILGSAGSFQGQALAVSNANPTGAGAAIDLSGSSPVASTGSGSKKKSFLSDLPKVLLVFTAIKYFLDSRRKPDDQSTFTTKRGKQPFFKSGDGKGEGSLWTLSKEDAKNGKNRLEAYRNKNGKFALRALAGETYDDPQTIQLLLDEDERLKNLYGIKQIAFERDGKVNLAKEREDGTTVLSTLDNGKERIRAVILPNGTTLRRFIGNRDQIHERLQQAGLRDSQSALHAIGQAYPDGQLLVDDTTGNVFVMTSDGKIDQAVFLKQKGSIPGTSNDIELPSSAIYKIKAPDGQVVFKTQDAAGAEFQVKKLENNEFEVTGIDTKHAFQLSNNRRVALDDRTFEEKSYLVEQTRPSSNDDYSISKVFTPKGPREYQVEATLEGTGKTAALTLKNPEKGWYRAPGSNFDYNKEGKIVNGSRIEGTVTSNIADGVVTDREIKSPGLTVKQKPHGNEFLASEIILTDPQGNTVAYQLQDPNKPDQQIFKNATNPQDGNEYFFKPGETAPRIWKGSDGVATFSNGIAKSFGQRINNVTISGDNRQADGTYKDLYLMSPRDDGNGDEKILPDPATLNLSRIRFSRYENGSPTSEPLTIHGLSAGEVSQALWFEQKKNPDSSYPTYGAPSPQYKYSVSDLVINVNGKPNSTLFAVVTRHDTLGGAPIPVLYKAIYGQNGEITGYVPQGIYDPNLVDEVTKWPKPAKYDYGLGKDPFKPQ